MPTADYARRIETTFQAIEESDEIHPENKRRLSDFKRDLKLDDTSDARIQKVTSHLKIIAEEVGDTPFTEMNKDDVKDLVAWVQDRDISEYTESDYKKAIKQFWKWLDGEDGDYPDCVDWLTTTGPSGTGKLPKDLLTRQDIDDLKDACRNPRDRAFIALLYETGARIGEVIDLTVGDIEDHQHGRKVVVEGKTGQRRIPLVEAVPALNRWLSEHPSGYKDAPLWCQLRDGEAQLSYNYLRQKLLQRAAERAEIDKPMNPHHFRHSRATHLATEFKEAELCEWFGWVQGSDVPGKYVHLSGRDIDETYNQLHGLESADEEADEPPVLECPRCGELNENDDQFCSRCGQALDVASAKEVEALTEQAEEQIPAVENKKEARVVRAVLQELRESPDDILSALE